MNEEEIKALEPKYTGNQRHLTEGEAEGIVHDPNFKNENEDDDLSDIDALAAGLGYGVFRRT
ncbi:hypothetical protein [Paenibacillus sp. LjRoot56]|uniref:hypothetical protein n=1 Tax=Paenibacillus sp. LjRoot56 TaxID=3342333 RepID=UPI003ECF2BC3